MTSTLHEALDDLVAAVPAHVGSPGLARTAWRAGRRRQIRRRIGTAALAVGVAAVVAVSLPPMVGEFRSLPPATGADGDRVQGYPQRIGHQWFVQDLPDRPGAVAGLMHRSIEPGRQRPADSSWYALSETGQRWRLPIEARFAGDAYPTISPDGRRLGYLTGDLGPYVIHDLVTGERVEFAEISSGRADARATYVTPGQTPGFWSADGSRLLIWGGRDLDGDGSTVLLLGIDGSLREVSQPAAVPAGFIGNDAVVWISSSEEHTEEPLTELAATITSLDGAVTRTVPLRPVVPWEMTSTFAWTGTVSPDGQQLLILDNTRTTDEALVYQFYLADGSQLGELDVAYPFAGPCGTGWAGANPVVPYADWGRGAGVAKLTGEHSTRIVAFERGEGIDCVIWASDALTGRAHGGVFGLTDWWWTWWWREIVAALLLVGGLWAFLRWRRRARTAAPGRQRRRPSTG